MGNCQRNISWRSTVKYFLVVTEESLQNMFLELLTRTGTKQTLTSIKDLGAATLINQVDRVGHVIHTDHHKVNIVHVVHAVHHKVHVVNVIHVVNVVLLKV